MTDTEKLTLRNLLSIYYDDIESDIEEAGENDENTSELDDLLTSVSDVMTSLR